LCPDRSPRDTTCDSGCCACVEDLAWLAGRWVGRGMGAQSEENWGPVCVGRMLGAYRHREQGKAVFQELMVVMEVGAAACYAPQTRDSGPGGVARKGSVR
jgi:hypothetical protein